jgi:hypothetical protein
VPLGWAEPEPEKTVEVACLITSDRSADPATLAAWARGHWHIENKLHWVRDVTYQEDKSLVRTSNAPRYLGDGAWPKWWVWVDGPGRRSPYRELS